MALFCWLWRRFSPSLVPALSQLAANARRRIRIGDGLPISVCHSIVDAVVGVLPKTSSKVIVFVTLWLGWAGRKENSEEQTSFGNIF